MKRSHFFLSTVCTQGLSGKMNGFSWQSQNVSTFNDPLVLNDFFARPLLTWSMDWWIRVGLMDSLVKVAKKLRQMSLQLEEKLPQDCEVFYKQTLFWLIMCDTTQNPFKRKAVMFQPLARPFQKHITVNIYSKEKKGPSTRHYFVML